MPFTYFYVDKCVRDENTQMDEVWLTEVPSPTTFKKNIIVWVDDNPGNNTAEIEKIKKREKGNIEILTLTSTKMADAWMK